MDIELRDYNDLKEAYQGRYEGGDSYLRRISDEVKTIKGEYEGFGTYLLRLSSEAKLERCDYGAKSFPILKVAVPAVSLAVVGVGLFLYLAKGKKNVLKRFHR
jgi:hypothetical protein